jgi:hypothetical protein
VKGGFKKKDMRFNFKKVSALATSALMAGMTIGMAAAANYPAPFVEGGASDVAIVVGSGAGVSMLDSVQSARMLDNGLRDQLAPTTSTTTSTVVGGGAVSLASGSYEVYLGEALGNSNHVTTITDDNLPTVLMDGTFTDDDGTDTDYTQIITVGTSTTNKFTFSDSSNDLDDPALLLELSSDSGAANQIYTWKASFDSGIEFNATASEGEELTIFGKTYTVGTATDGDTLVLLGGSDTATINVGETVTLTVDGETYEVTLTGISDASVASAGLTINGGSKTFTEGQTKSLAGVDVYMKTVFRTGESAGYVEVQLGSNKLTLENNKKVKWGSDDTTIKGTNVTLTGGVNALSAIEIQVAAQDNDEDFVLVGDSFVDPVFGTLKVKFTGVDNAPVFTEERDTSTSRKMIDIVSGDDRTLEVTLTNAGGETATIPFVFNGGLTDDNSKAIHVVEGETLSEDEYFTLNSGSYQHFMQVDTISMDGSTDADEVVIYDQFTGTSYTEDDTDLDAGNGQIIGPGGQTYTVEKVSTTSVKIYSSDYVYSAGAIDGTVDVYPYIELMSGRDHRFAFTDDVTITNITNGTILTLPTGTITVTSPVAASTSTGTAYYNYTLSENAVDGYSDIVIAMDANQTGITFAETSPGILFVEEEDNSDSDAKNSIVLVSTDDGSNSEMTTPLFAGSATSGSVTWGDTDYIGYLTAFGTYVLKDSSDADQTLVSLTYPEQQMYATVHFAEEGASITSSGGTSNSAYDGQVYLDTETSAYSSKNVIVVGGSCINSAAAALVGGSFCGDAWKEATGAGPGEYVIKGYSDSTITGKMALLVAGWSAADTVNAATYLKNNAVDTSGSYKGTTSTSATAVTTAA